VRYYAGTERSAGFLLFVVLFSIGATPIGRLKNLIVDTFFGQLCWQNRADLLFVIDSLTVADLPFVIKDSREKRRKVEKGRRTNGNELSECESH
jgi:hypothetical protein